MVVPWYLVDFQELGIERYMSRRFWINVNLPADLAPGMLAAANEIEPAIDWVLWTAELLMIAGAGGVLAGERSRSRE